MPNNKESNKTKRRDFLKISALASLPFALPTSYLSAGPIEKDNTNYSIESSKTVNFLSDGLMMSPQEYLQKLIEFNSVHPIESDFYGSGGVVSILEKEFAELTGKEKAIYLPTGTMANQLALRLLNANNTKAIVPENSHIYRDEADAAQSVHRMRLVPSGDGKPYFTVDDLKATIDYLEKGEVFKSGLGTVAIENPVRRADGAFVSLSTIKDISKFCKEKGLKMHLDGARIHLASFYTGVSIKEYASYFDTVYISLYKYLHADGGAMLCGDAEVIDQVLHQIKIHGGSIYKNWNNTSMALNMLEGLEDRWKKVLVNAENLINQLNKIDQVTITKLENGTNIHKLAIKETIDVNKMAKSLADDFGILINPRVDEKGFINFFINESLLRREVGDLLASWQKAIKKSVF